MTLFEALWALFFLAVVVALLSLTTMQTTECSLDTERLQRIKIEQDAALFRVKRRRLPGSIKELYPDGQLPRDRWGHPYLLTVEDGEVVMLSHGADGLPGDQSAELVGSEP